ncbi:MAG: hypothetical protein LBG61_06315 [Burkholderiales bacterium]|jgi:hypothetical protein|nr:hypothetical protein [Burkholderiales bacterium]
MKMYKSPKTLLMGIIFVVLIPFATGCSTVPQVLADPPIADGVIVEPLKDDPIDESLGASPGAPRKDALKESGTASESTAHGSKETCLKRLVDEIGIADLMSELNTCSRLSENERRKVQATLASRTNQSAGDRIRLAWVYSLSNEEALVSKGAQLLSEEAKNSHSGEPMRRLAEVLRRAMVNQQSLLAKIRVLVDVN